MAGKPRATHSLAPKEVDQETCLIVSMGQGEFIDYVRERAVGGQEMSRDALATAWRKAMAYYEKLQAKEAGLADTPQVLPLPKAMQAHTRKLAASPGFKASFSNVPVAFGLVELDKLVVYQHYFTRSSVDHMKSTLAQPVSPAGMLKLCLPLDPPDTGFRLARQDGGRFVFVADNHDGRFLGAQLIDPSRIEGLVVTGHARAVLALPFGFTTNVLNVIRFGTRMVLNNGYHRAVSLKALGVTHAPCLIQVCGQWDDVAQAAAGAIYDNGENFFTHPRPTLLKDFFNPRLTRNLASYRLRKEIRVTFEVDTLKLSI